MKSEQEPLELIRRYIEGTASEEDRNALQEQLRHDPATRRLYARYANIDAALGSGSIALKAPVLRAQPPRTTWLSWRPLTAAAAGIMLGMFCTSVVFGFVGPRVVEKVKTVFSEGFESGVAKTAPGVPREVGLWSGDEAEVAKSTPEVKAHGGTKMLRFLSATYPGENSPRSQWGDVYRIVDVRGVAGAGRTVARVSASFARGPVAAEAQFSCIVEAMALDQDLSGLPSRLDLAWLSQHCSASGSRKVALSPMGEWKQMSVEVPITSETRYVMLHLAVMQEQPAPESGAVQFPGHYMDDVKVEVVTAR